MKTKSGSRPAQLLRKDFCKLICRKEYYVLVTCSFPAKGVPGLSPGHSGVGLCFRTWGCRNLYVGPCMAMAVNLMSACNRFSFNF